MIINTKPFKCRFIQEHRYYDNLNDLIPDFEDGNMVYRLGDADITLMS